MKQLQVHNKPNQIRAFWALVKASLLGSLRNPTTLFFNFLFPFIFISIFGVLDFSSMSFSVAVRPGSVQQGMLYDTLKEVDALKLVTDKTDEAISDDLLKGRTAVAITIKEEQPLQISQTQKIQTYSLHIEQSTASQSEAASVVSILQTVTGSINAAANPQQVKLVSTETTQVEGRKYKQIDFVLPGQLAFALLTNALFGITFTFIAFKKELILKRFFASPVSKSAILASELFSKMIIAMFQSMLIISVGHFMFGFTLAHGFVTALSMLALSFIGIIVFLAFGLLIPSIAKTEDAASPIAQLIMMPQLFLSGAFFPLESFPAFLQPIAKIMPMTFLNDSFKMVAFEGVSIIETLPKLGGLLLWGLGIYLIVLFTFKWE